MGTIIYIPAGIIAALLVVALAWRLGSRTHSLPCPAWLRWMVELDNPFTKTSRAEVIVSHLDLEPGMAVLDVGCGPGRVTIPLGRRVGPRGEVVAMDIQGRMLERARDKARAAGLDNIHFLEAGAGQGRLERSRFDRALLVSVLGEIPDRDAALKEIFDALRPGGMLSVTEVIFDPHFQNRRTVARQAGAHGFREKEFYGGRMAFTVNFEKPR